MALHTRILIGLILGAAIGITANYLGAVPVEPGVVDARDADGDGMHDGLEWVAENIAEPIGKVFLRLIFMVVLPLVFGALVLGVVGMGDIRKLGRVGLRTLAYTVGMSLTAVAIGVTVVNTIRPGDGLDPDKRESLRAMYEGKAADVVGKARQHKSVRDTLLDLIPENPLQEMVGAMDGSSKGNGILAVMFFALIFGVALTFVPVDRAAPLVKVLEAVFDASLIIIGFAMRLAPYAVACLIFGITSRLGLDVLTTLLSFMATALLGLSLHLFVVYPIVLRVLGRASPLDFFRKTGEVAATAFATSSSNATLPVALKAAKENLRLPPAISHFVLTVGAAGNQNGTALYEGVVVLFLAQVFGVDLTVPQQVTVVMMSVLAGIGTAGVPGGSIPMIVIVLQTVGVPPEGIGLILGVDRILDMCRTVVNVIGDLAIAKCVSRQENGLARGSAAPAAHCQV